MLSFARLYKDGIPLTVPRFEAGSGGAGFLSQGSLLCLGCRRLSFRFSGCGAGG